MTRDAALLIAKKLKALSEKSESGEKFSAEKKLKAFCLLYGLDIDEYSTETIRASIPFTTQNEKILLSSIMCMILEVDAVRGRVENESFIFQCTQRQLEDILEAFDFYKNMYSDYVDGILFALINKNEIKNKKLSSSEFKMDDMTPEERKEYLGRLNGVKTGQSEEANRSNQNVNEESPPDADLNGIAQQNKKNKKTERIQRMLSTVEQNKWVKKVRAKIFLN